MDPSDKTFWIRACFVNQDQDSLVLVLVTRQNWQPSRHTTLTRHWFNVNSTNWVGADNHSPERGLIEGPTFLSYEFQQVLIQWDWKVLRCCCCFFFLCFSFLFFLFFSLSAPFFFCFLFFFDLVAAVHMASLSPQQQNKCWQRWFRSDESTQWFYDYHEAHE